MGSPFLSSGFELPTPNLPIPGRSKRLRHVHWVFLSAVEATLVFICPNLRSFDVSCGLHELDFLFLLKDIFPLAQFRLSFRFREPVLHPIVPTTAWGLSKPISLHPSALKPTRLLLTLPPAPSVPPLFISLASVVL